jgi:hypothetical protein
VAISWHANTIHPIECIIKHPVSGAYFDYSLDGGQSWIMECIESKPYGDRPIDSWTVPEIDRATPCILRIFDTRSGGYLYDTVKIEIVP